MKNIVKKNLLLILTTVSVAVFAQTTVTWNPTSADVTALTNTSVHVVNVGSGTQSFQIYSTRPFFNNNAVKLEWDATANAVKMTDNGMDKAGIAIYVPSTSDNISNIVVYMHTTNTRKTLYASGNPCPQTGTVTSEALAKTSTGYTFWSGAFSKDVYYVCGGRSGGSGDSYFDKVEVTFASGETPPATIDVTGVTLDKTSTSIEQGNTEQLTATVAPNDATDPSVTWSSDDTNVATVDENGLVSAVGAGTANITVTTTDGGKTATCAVTVTAPAAPILVTGISIPASAILAIGESQSLTITYTPSDANTGKAITSWVSSDEAVATVNNGTITGVAAGTATITATSQGGFTASCTVTVQAVAVTGVTLNKTTLTLKEEGFETLTPTIAPSNATNKAVTWTSSNEAVATVDANGKVTGVAEGQATITVTTVDGNKTHTCTVTVEPKSATPETNLTLHYPEIYEDPAGYNTPLVKYQGREYEVFYTAKGKIGGQGSGVPLVYVDATGSEISNATRAKDGWFEYAINSGDGSSSETSQEFTVARGTWKTTTDNYLMMRVKGYDMFRFYAKEKKDSDPNQQLHVFIDDMESELPMTHSTSATIREFAMTTGEHVIKVTATGSSNQYIYGWSLRVSNDPIVRHLKGPKEQTVYQTKAIERVSFRVRRAASHRLTWLNNNAISGVNMVNGTNDSVFVEGIADAAPGVYTYKIEALDAQGAVASSETGKITIQTHVFDCRLGNDFTTNIGEAIKPLNFIYYASSSDAISLQWAGEAVSGLALTFSQDSIATLSGTPADNTPGGTYSYSIVAAGGNTVSGTITLVVPDPYFGEFEEVKVKDNQLFSFAIQAMHVNTIYTTGDPDWVNGVFDEATGLITFSGTPNVGGPYPKTFTFTMTATPKYAGKQAITKEVTIKVIDPNQRTLLLVCKNLSSIDDDPIAKYLKGSFDVTLRTQDKIASASLSAFDLILISENVDADNAAVLALVKSAPKPVLNMKAFTYVYMRDEDTPNGWGEADNGSLSANGQSITIRRPDHPIIQNLQMNLQYGQTLRILTSINKKGLMPINIFMQGTYSIATALTRSKTDYNGDGDPQTFLHEQPASLRGGQKYICMPIALSSSTNLTLDGMKLVDAVVSYLLSSDQAELDDIPLQITSFSIDGVEGTIEEDYWEGTITLDIDTVAHPGINLRKVAPVITVASDMSHVVPLSGDTVDLSWSGFMPVAYVVTDYINRFVYHVSVNLYAPQGLEDVTYEPGMWVNIFDIYGRKITLTNQDIHTIDLPHGIYIVLTENGHSLKIMR